MTTGFHTWSTTPGSNASADSSVNWAEGMAPSAVNDSARALMARLAEWRDDISGTITTGGTSTAYTVSTNTGFESLAAMDGQLIMIIPHADNGAAATLAVDGLSAVAINFSTGVAVQAGALKEGTPYLLTYVSATPEFILIGGLGVIVGTLALTALNLVGGTALTSLAIDDSLAVYDLSATTNKKIAISDVLKIIDALTAKTSLASDDEFPIYDTTGTAAKKVTFANLTTSLSASTTFKSPTRQYLTSGTSATYTTPSSPAPKTLIIRMIGGGGGGGSTTTVGNDGTATTFNSISANPGLAGGATFSAGGAGGTAGSGSASLRLPGSAGTAAQNGADSAVAGSPGAPGIFGMGAGAGTTGNGGAGGANTGAGGAGGGGANTGAGGGSGEYVEIVITSPSPTYTYTIGAGGAAQTAGTDGGAGGSGLIIVEEYY